jgi:hypothetical protein
MRKAVEWLKDTAFDLWQLSHPIKNKGPMRVLQHWKRPLPGWTKCIVDASFIAEEGHGATGMVLRDEGGEFAGEERGGMTTASMLCPRKRRPAMMESSSLWRSAASGARCLSTRGSNVGTNLKSALSYSRLKT